MQLTLSGIENVVYYLDDILIFSTDLESHLETLEQVLQRLKEHGIELGLNKCEFCKDTVQFLGFKVTGEGLKPAPEMVKSLVEAKVPTNLTELR